MNWDLDVDAVGMICPLPVLKLRKRLLAQSVGTVVRLRTSDPAALIDVPHFCAEGGHTLLGQDQEGEVLAFYVKRGAPERE